MMIAALGRGIRRLDDTVQARGDLRAVALLRIAAGPLVLLHLRPFLDLAASGVTYADRFHQPFFEWYPEAGPGLYTGLLRAGAVTAVLLSLGVLTRWVSAFVAGVVGYNLFLSVTHFHHNRAFLLILLIGLTLLPSGRHLSIDALAARRLGRAGPEPAPLWPLWLLRFEVAVAYGASGFSKLIDPDWWNGLVLRLRIEQWRDVAAAEGTPEWLLDLLASETFMWWFAKAVVLTELLIALGLAVRRTRLAAIWVAIGFHVAVELTAEVQVFSWAALAALVIWVTPRSGDRRLVVTPEASRGAALTGVLVRYLDWTGRFAVERRAGDIGPALCLFDRSQPDGGVQNRVGAEAARMVLSRLPATFWFAGPLLLPGIRSWWDRRAAGWFGESGGGAAR
jgi:hypothetical protein